MLGGCNLHHDRTWVSQIVGVGVVFAVSFLVAVVVFVPGEVPLLLSELGRVFRRLPVGIAAMTRGRTAPLDQTGFTPAVEYPGRQRHVAGAPHGVTFADEHRNQDEQP